MTFKQQWQDLMRASSPGHIRAAREELAEDTADLHQRAEEPVRLAAEALIVALKGGTPAQVMLAAKRLAERTGRPVPYARISPEEGGDEFSAAVDARGQVTYHHEAADGDHSPAARRMRDRREYREDNEEWDGRDDWTRAEDARDEERRHQERMYTGGYLFS